MGAKFKPFFDAPDDNAGGGDSGQVTYPAHLSQMAGDLKTNEVLAGHKTITDLGQGYLDLSVQHTALQKDFENFKKTVPAPDDMIIKPGENATPEEITAFRKAIGAITSADDIGIELPKDAKWADQFAMNKLKDLAVKEGLNKSQLKSFQGLAAELSRGLMDQKIQLAKETAANVQSQLKEDWKHNYQKNYDYIYKAASHYGNDLVEHLKNHPDGNNIAVLKMLSDVGRAISEDDFHPGSAAVTDKDDFYGEMDKHLG